MGLLLVLYCLISLSTILSVRKSRQNVVVVVVLELFTIVVIHYVRATWPSPNCSNIQLLGIFEDPLRISETANLSRHSNAMFKSAVILSQRYNIKVGENFIHWCSVETDGNVIETLSETCRVLSVSKLVGIVGPGLSSEAHLLATHLPIEQVYLLYRTVQLILIYLIDMFIRISIGQFLQIE